MAIADILVNQDALPPQGPPVPWPHETRDLTNVQPSYEQNTFSGYMNGPDDLLLPVEPYGWEEEIALNWKDNPASIARGEQVRPVTPWLSGLWMAPDGTMVTPPEVARDRALRRMEFNEARLAEATDAETLSQNYLYQRLKPWEARPWVRDPTNTLPPPDENERLGRWRDQVFAWYGVTPSAARFLGQVGLTGPEPGAQPGHANYYYPGANTIDLQDPFASVLMHEYAHAADPRLQPWSDNQYPDTFFAALARLYQDNSEDARYYRMGVNAYPGRANVYTKPTETYAEIAAKSAQLRPYKMPPYLTPFYDYLFAGGGQGGGRR